MPFLAGVLIAPLGLYLRARIDDDSQGTAQQESGVLKTVFARDGKLLLLAFMLVIGGTSAHFIVLYYMSTYAIKVLHLPMDTAMWCGILSGAVMLVVSPIGGLWSDRFGRKRVTFLSRLLLTLLILPGFYAIAHRPSVGTLYFVICALAALHSINAGATGPLLPEMFPRSTRATGLSISYAAGVSIFGGFAQFVVTWLIGATGNAVAPAWYVIVCGVASLIALAFITDRTCEEI